MQDIKADVANLDDLLRAGNIALADAEEFKASTVTGGKGGNAFFTPAGSEVSGQGMARTERHPGARPGVGADPTRSKRTVGETGVTLSPDELKLQRGSDQPASGHGAVADHNVRLRWEEGATKWALNEYNKWVFQMRQLSIPLMAGPSGTTNMLMNMGKLLGSDPFDTRLACMGYLLPAHHHSLVEIMVAAQPHGCDDYVGGQRMYRSIRPFSESELRGFGGGKFPDEPAPAVASSSGGSSHTPTPAPGTTSSTLPPNSGSTTHT